jgi:hypothetical protein
MGAEQFTVKMRGVNMQDAFNKAVAEAEEEYGHQQGYSGKINNHHSFYDKTAEFKRSKKSIGQFMEDAFDSDKLSKHDHPWGVCIQEPVKNSNKIKTQVEHNVEKGTKKWVQKYRVLNYGEGADIDYLKKGDAVKKAREICEKTKRTVSIDIIKVLEKGSCRTATIRYKESKGEREGTYVFFGEANS